MINVLILNVFFKSRSHSHQNKFNLKVIALKIQQNIFKASQTAWKKFLKPALNITNPYMRMAVSAKTKNPKVGQATANFLKSISGVKF